jgi:hypothetical protein
MEHTTFVGLDVHKRTTSVAIAEPGRTGEVRLLGEIPSTPAALPPAAAHRSQPLFPTAPCSP